MSKFSFNLILKVVVAVLTAVFEVISGHDSDEPVQGLS